MFKMQFGIFSGLMLVVGSVYFAAAGRAGQPQSSYAFELTDGYFQADIQKPVHFMHPTPYPQQLVSLGGSVHLWYTLQLRQGEKNPCDMRSQTTCSVSIGFVSLSDPTYKWHIRDKDYRTDGKLDMAYGIPIDREKTPLGAGKFVWTISKDSKVLFSHEILVEVR